jgi:reactive intermediate/imine deaminase
MKIQKITIDPDPYEPFRLAQGYRVGDLLFISGQAAIDDSGQMVGVGDFDAQAKQVFANLERVLMAGGSSLKNVIKVTIFLRDMSNFDKIVELRGRFFTSPYPADTIVEARRKLDRRRDDLCAGGFRKRVESLSSDGGFYCACALYSHNHPT